jgi:hypothetical protein
LNRRRRWFYSRKEKDGLGHGEEEEAQECQAAVTHFDGDLAFSIIYFCVAQVVMAAWRVRKMKTRTE